MRKATHTPGPWDVDKNGHLHIGGEDVGYALMLSPYRATFEEAVCNAQLVAAAPDLLSALDRLLLVAIMQGADVDDGSAVQQAKLAIRKATGRTPCFCGSCGPEKRGASMNRRQFDASSDESVGL